MYNRRRYEPPRERALGQAQRFTDGQYNTPPACEKIDIGFCQQQK